MKVLFTRPAAPSNALVQALRRNGDEVTTCPALAIEARQAPAAQLSNVRLANCFVFVSTHAVRCGWRHVASRAADIDVCWCAVGPATAAELSAHGVSVVAPRTPGSSEALLALDVLQSVRDKRIVIVRGMGGLDTLFTVLGARGAHVDALEVYERRSADVTSLADALAADVDVVVVSSGDGLDAVVTTLKHRKLQRVLNDATFVVPSDRVAVQARAAGVVRVVASKGVGDAAVIATLQDLRANSQG